MNFATDVARIQEKSRRKRLWKVFLFLSLPAAFFIKRAIAVDPVRPGLPDHIDWFIIAPLMSMALIIGIIVLIAVVMVKSRPKILYPSDPNFPVKGFADVAGLPPELESELRTALKIFQNPEKFKEVYGGRPFKGILLAGPPGTGKTRLGMAFAYEANVPFIIVQAQNLQSGLYGATALRVNSLFRRLRKLADTEGGVIPYFDELDSVARARSGVAASSAEASVHNFISEENPVMGPLLAKLDGLNEPRGAQYQLAVFLNKFLRPEHRLYPEVKAHFNIMAVASTNRQDIIDRAIVRPGRIDRQFQIGIPTRKSREELVEYHNGIFNIDPELRARENVEYLARITQGYSQAQIYDLYNYGATFAFREDAPVIKVEHFLKARLRIELGVETPVDYTPEEESMIAYHEGAHALVCYLLAKSEMIDVVSIIKRYDALGLVAHSPTEERFLKKRSELTAQLRVSLAGLVAEQLVFGESTTGPSSDLSNATTIASLMVGVYGMEGSLISFMPAQVQQMNPVARILADESSRAKVDKLLLAAKKDAKKLITEKRSVLDTLVAKLIEKQELTGPQAIAIIEQAEAA